MAISRNRNPKRGFTLLEALVALIMFAVLMLALSMALHSAITAKSGSEQEQDTNTTVRAVFGALNRDIQSAYVSANSPISVFATQITGSSNGSTTSPTGGASGPNGGTSVSNVPGSPGILMLSTLTNRVQDDSTDPSGAGAAGTVVSQPQSSATANTNATPQWDTSLVRYDLDFRPER